MIEISFVIVWIIGFVVILFVEFFNFREKAAPTRVPMGITRSGLVLMNLTMRHGDKRDETMRICEGWNNKFGDKFKFCKELKELKKVLGTRKLRRIYSCIWLFCLVAALTLDNADD